jgi:hypothetical protein
VKNGTGLTRASRLSVPLVVSVSNHEHNRSSFDKLRMSGVLSGVRAIASDF